jgi:hypothetical protein
MNFGDLAFFPHGNYPDSGIQAEHFFPNGYGVSVVQFTSPYGGGSYGADEGLYELAVLQGLEEDWEICYDTSITDDVMGYLTIEDVETVLNQVEKLK